MTARWAETGRAGYELPQAARLQGPVDLTDMALVDYVRLRRPRCLWWWGQGRRDGHVGGICYLCDRLFVSWDMRHPITRAAQDAILAHRGDHVVGGSVTLASRTSAKSADGDATPAGGQS